MQRISSGLMSPPHPKSGLPARIATLALGLLLNTPLLALQPSPKIGASVPDSTLPAAVAEALQRAKVPADALAAIVMPVTAGAARWQVQADRAMQPASTMKLVTSIVALDRLGPNHRGFTELLTQAPQQGDVLAGDLVLRGGADPELGLPQLWGLLAELRWQGIREIAGDIVLDRSLFRAAPGPNAPAFDAWPEFAYNGVPDALQLNHNLMGLEITSEDPTRPGSVVARAWPPLPGLEIDASAMRLNDRPCREWNDDWIIPPMLVEPAPGQLRISLRGGFPKACSQRSALALIDRQALAERHLRWVWQGLGGEWRGQLRESGAPLIAPLGAAAQAAPSTLPDAPPANWLAPGVALAGTPGVTPPGLRVLSRRLARPWGETLRMMNKHSDNANSRLLYLSLGLGAMADQPAVSTAELASRSVQAWMAERRIASAGLVMDNGSGLSRSERISPRQLALMLQAAHNGRWASELMMSLPVAGVDGSMRRRLKTSPAAGWARLKGGTLKNVTALAGYVPDGQGRWWVLAAMINHDQAAAARPALDALVDWVARGGPGQK